MELPSPYIHFGCQRSIFDRFVSVLSAECVPVLGNFAEELVLCLLASQCQKLSVPASDYRLIPCKIFVCQVVGKATSPSEKFSRIFKPSHEFSVASLHSFGGLLSLDKSRLFETCLCLFSGLAEPKSERPCLYLQGNPLQNFRLPGNSCLHCFRTSRTPRSRCFGLPRFKCSLILRFETSKRRISTPGCSIPVLAHPGSCRFGVANLLGDWRYSRPIQEILHYWGDWRELESIVFH